MGDINGIIPSANFVLFLFHFYHGIYWSIPIELNFRTIVLLIADIQAISFRGQRIPFGTFTFSKI